MKNVFRQIEFGSAKGDRLIFRFCLKTLRSSFENLRTNGVPVEIIGDFSVHAEPVEAFLGFFSRIFLDLIERKNSLSPSLSY
jgi:hypothetical protein